jgi:hypothetical protein
MGHDCDAKRQHTDSGVPPLPALRESRARTEKGATGHGSCGLDLGKPPGPRLRSEEISNYLIAVFSGLRE